MKRRGGSSSSQPPKRSCSSRKQPRRRESPSPSQQSSPAPSERPSQRSSPPRSSLPPSEPIEISEDETPSKADVEDNIRQQLKARKSPIYAFFEATPEIVFLDDNITPDFLLYRCCICREGIKQSLRTSDKASTAIDDNLKRFSRPSRKEMLE
ncbi:hypothetical protein EV360DRAFT_90859 [Lentinula raphanica]|nr:hypothetical protein EV360DRAFT_90859 [Lentinula raphanica]